jgi:hypothetical protein
MQVAYEDRIAELRAQVDRIMSRVKVGDQVRIGQNRQDRLDRPLYWFASALRNTDQ